MRPLGVEPGNEGIEALLLLDGVAWRTRDFLFESEVHALVASVLLRVAGLMRSMAMPGRSH